MRDDWPEIERKYTQGVKNNGRLTFPTQRELAQEYGIDAGALGKKAKEQNWLQKRQNFHSKLQANSQQKSINKLSDEASEQNVEVFQTAREGITKIRQNISKEEDSLELERLSRALLNFQRIARLAIGESTDDVDDRSFFKRMLERRYQEWQNK